MAAGGAAGAGGGELARRTAVRWARAAFRRWGAGVPPPWGRTDPLAAMVGAAGGARAGGPPAGGPAGGARGGAPGGRERASGRGGSSPWEETLRGDLWNGAGPGMCVHSDLWPLVEGAPGAGNPGLARTARDLGVDPGWFADVCARLQRTYLGPISVELEHIPCSEKRKWGWRRLSQLRREMGSPQDRVQTLGLLLNAELFEHYLARRFKASKRFSLEGGESLIPGMHTLLSRASRHGVEEVVLGMAHRGRLNMLRNVLGKPLGEICIEMEGRQSEFHVGDVKYHLGMEAELNHPGGRRMTVRTVPNPSHLEAGAPVVLGEVYALQQGLSYNAGTEDGSHRPASELDGKRRTMGVIVHGDAALAGLGMPAECLQLSHLPAFSVGGTIHVVINNQVGFTTWNNVARSTHHATDVLKTLPMPVLHVNGDCPEYVIRAFAFAVDWRERYGEDICVDLMCYRRHSHNEQEDPSVVLPVQHKFIDTHPTTVEQYAQKLEKEVGYSAEEVAKLRKEIEGRMELQGSQAESFTMQPAEWLEQTFIPDALAAPAASTGIGVMEGKAEPTGLPFKTLEWVNHNLCRIPEGFEAHPEILKLNAGRLKMVQPGGRVDMATAEALALGTLLLHRSSSPEAENFEGKFAELEKGGGGGKAKGGEKKKDPALGLNYGHYHVRLTGQDVERGTFNQRHAVLIDQRTGEPYMPLNHVVKGGQDVLKVANSPLSEAAVLGFEYGVSVAAKTKALVIWEGQFGDFANNAQVIIDEFVASGEEKWGQQSALVMMLPHGYDGQGPDHSSARLERFLMMCKDDADNLPGTSAQERKDILKAFNIAAGHKDYLTRDEVRRLMDEWARTHVRQEDAVRVFAEIMDHHGHADPDCPDDVITLPMWEDMMVHWSRRNAEKDSNLFVVNPTSPAQLFHVLRRQMNRNYLKPLVLMSPKYLFHHKPCTSDIEDFGPGTFFHRIIDDSSKGDNTRHRDRHPSTGAPFLVERDQVRRLIICSGQVFYALNRCRRQRKVRDIAIVRLEQLSPFPHDRLAKVVSGYPFAEIVWVQEEPKNAGAWAYVKPRFETSIRELQDLFPHRGPTRPGGHLRYIGRPPSAACATASLQIHLKEMQDILDQALTF